MLLTVLPLLLLQTPSSQVGEGGPDGLVLPPPSVGDLGRIAFPNSGAPAAQEPFLRGVLLLHSFEYDDAAESFREAQEADPDFALAYWGEAMTYTHPIWVQQDRDAARAALARLAPTPEGRLAKAPTEREKSYLRTLDVLYGDGDKVSRDNAYAAEMERLAREYPDDLEARSFWALAVLGTCQYDRDIPTYMRAAAIVEEVFAKNPKHPGAAHYLIHSYDDPIHAPLGLRAAREYAAIAPTASHAQHMPSHIFVALGMWDLNNSSNVAAWEAGEARVAAKSLGVDERNFHALWWLEYGLLQQGRYGDARQQLAIIREDAAASGSARTRVHLAYMRAAYIIETGEWEAISPVDTAGLEPSGVASDLLATGMSAVRLGDLDAARQALSQMKAAREEAVAKAKAASGTARTTGAEIMEAELEALIAFEDGKTDWAVELLMTATDLEDGTSFEFGPPIPVKPSHELFGEVLLELNRPAEAQAQFEKALARAPKRALSLLGLARAAEAQGDTGSAERTYAELRAQWERADADLPPLRVPSQGGAAH